MHTILIIFGISAVLLHSDILFKVIQYLGGLYLIYLGFNSLKIKESKYEKEGLNISVSKKYRTYMVQGFLCNAMNPKAILFFVSVFSVVVSAKLL